MAYSSFAFWNFLWYLKISLDPQWVEPTDAEPIDIEGQLEVCDIAYVWLGGQRAIGFFLSGCWRAGTESKLLKSFENCIQVVEKNTPL